MRPGGQDAGSPMGLLPPRRAGTLDLRKLPPEPGFAVDQAAAQEAWRDSKGRPARRCIIGGPGALTMGATGTDFERLYRETFPDVRRFVFHLVHDESLADELTQDAFLRAHEGWNEFRGDAPPRVWLFRIARNISVDFLRGPRAQALRDRSLETGAGEANPAGALIAASGGSPSTVEETARRAEMSECVQEFVRTLPETLRTPLLLHDTEGLTNAEVARVLGCSLQAAKMRLHRARARLREMMAARCDLFHDERNVLSCLPAEPRPTEPAFISLQDVAVR